MQDKIYHSKILDLDFKIKQGKSGTVAVFEDNVNYQQYEMNQIKGLSDKSIRVIHNLKIVFEGSVL